MTSTRLKAIFASATLGISMGVIPHAGIAMTQAQNRELDAILDAVNDRFVLHDKVADRQNNERIFLGTRARRDNFTDEEFAASANRLMGRLDPHSHYYDAKETERMMAGDSGYLVGIGVKLTLQDGFPKILKVFPGSPAEAGGIKKGDLILHVHDTVKNKDIDTDDSDLNKAVGVISGEPNTVVNIRVKRQGTPQPIDLTFTRARVETSPVTYEFDKKVGYIKLDQFNNKASADVIGAIAVIEDAHGAQQGYILDLRGNPGGSVVEAVNIISAFANQPVEKAITMKSNSILSSFSYPVISPGNILHGKRLIVLIDETSVSASELTSGGLKDLGLAEIYGNQSYGKGSAWSKIPMPSGNFLGVTSYLYYLPSGKSIQLQGVVPNVLYVPTAEQSNKAIEADAKNLSKLREKFPNDPSKRIIYNEASENNALHLSDPNVLDHSTPTKTCTLISETPAQGTPEPLLFESDKSTDQKKLDAIKACAWESLTGQRLNTRIGTYHGENLRFTPPAP